MKSFRNLLIALALLVGFALPANAATCTWSGGAANWDNINTASWSCGHVPTTSDDVVMTNSGTVTVCGALTTTCPNGTGVVTVKSITLTSPTAATDFSAINPNVTTTASIALNSGTNSVLCGSGTWTTNVTSGVAIVMGATPVGSGCTNADFVLSATPTNSRTLSISVTVKSITVTDNAWNALGVIISGILTTGNFTLTNVGQLSTVTNFTITGTFSTNSNSSHLLLMYSSGTTRNITFSGGAQTISYAAIQNITAVTNELTINNGYNLGGITLVTVNPPASGGGIIGG